MSFLNDVLIQTGVYLGVVLLTFLIFNFLTKGFLRNYLLVKASRGKKVLVRIYSITGKYYKPGIIKSGMLSYKDRAGEKPVHKVTKTEVFNEMGVNCVEVDEETGGVKTVNFDAVEAMDNKKVDHLMVRCLYKPSFKDNPREMILLILMALSLGANAIIIYLVLNIGKVGVV